MSRKKRRSREVDVLLDNMHNMSLKLGYQGTMVIMFDGSGACTWAWTFRHGQKDTKKAMETFAKEHLDKSK